MAERGISKKREDFCGLYATLGNVSEAAEKAGFEKSSALKEGLRCLGREKCRERIREVAELLSGSGSVAAGLRRLAFGSCNDAVYLVFADELPPASVISGLDLFNVSEIRRVKGGGVEVKLFDRQKALEKLLELDTSVSDREKAESLIEALTCREDEQV